MDTVTMITEDMNMTYFNGTASAAEKEEAGTGRDIKLILPPLVLLVLINDLSHFGRQEVSLDR